MPGAFEEPDPGWPEDPANAGNTIHFGSAILDGHFFPFYIVSVWGFDGAYYRTGINPTLGYAAFADDNAPPEIDICERFGQVRWYEDGRASTRPIRRRQSR